MTPRPEAAVIVFPGSNGDRDLYECFERAGFAPSYHDAGAELPHHYKVAGLPGGFSYGDYWRAGMLASESPAVRSLPGHVAEGGLVIGICNGFQILVEADQLPGALYYNHPPGFRHRWLHVRVTATTDSPWFYQVEPGTRLHLPMAHGEGNYISPSPAIRCPLVYERNPNGSMGDTAAVLDTTGRVLGIMPHPERACDADLGSCDGLRLFQAARRWIEVH